MGRKQEELRYCKDCEKLHPVSAFGRYAHRDNKLKPICRRAEAKRERQRYRGKKLLRGLDKDAAALYMSRLHKQAPGSMLDANMLRAIMDHQQCRDPFTGVQFVLPEDATQYNGWERWIRTVPVGQKERTPILVPVSGDDYHPGNVLFVRRDIGLAVLSCGCLAEFRQMMRDPAMPIVAPQPDALRALIERWRAEVKNEARAQAAAYRDERTALREAQKETTDDITKTDDGGAVPAVWDLQAQRRHDDGGQTGCGADDSADPGSGGSDTGNTSGAV